MKVERPFTLAISGPCGAGKSLFVKYLSEMLSIDPTPEPIPDDLLRQFELSPSTHALSLQRHFIHTRSLMYERTKSDGVRLLDRTIDEDCEVFFRLHLALGFLTPEQYAALEGEARILLSKAGDPDATIILTATVNCLVARMRADKEHCRPEWLIASLNTQMQLYERWIASQPKACVIETTALTCETLEQIARKIAKWLQTDQAVPLQTILEAFVSAP